MQETRVQSLGQEDPLEKGMSVLLRKDQDCADVVDVGESDKYEALCRECYYELTKNKK